MLRLEVFLIVAPDSQPEKRTCLQVIAALNAKYQGQLEFLPRFTLNAPDLTLILVWSEADQPFATTLKRAETPDQSLLFRKTDPVAFDLGNRAKVLEKLERRELLDKVLEEHATLTPIPFSEAHFYNVLERELEHVANKRLGISSTALNFRPQPSSLYLQRKRLLKELPDTLGHVVQLVAPYGYGKTVLAAQWAEQLEGEGWRIVWLSARQFSNSTLQKLIAEALGVAGDTPEQLLREQLWKTPTLLVLEDINAEQDLRFVLSELAGLVLLASRETLQDETLLELAVANRVTHLTANDLAFSLAEAEHLIGDSRLAASLHAETLGWALPLQVATLTGAAPDAASLVEGIRASLTGAAWQELLFLSALPYLPRQAATSETQRLVMQGLVQALQTSYRLHPYIAEQVLALHLGEVTNLVVQEASRLPLLLQGEAFERVGDAEHLVKILETTEAELWERNPGQLVRWDQSIKGLPSSRRHWTVGVAQARLGNFEGAAEHLLVALEDPDLSANQQLGILRELCLPLGITNNLEAQKLLARAEPLLENADPELVARFLNNAALIYIHMPDPMRAIELAEAALTHYPKDSRYKIATELNLVLFRYDHTGDFAQRHAAQIASLERVSKVYPVQAVGQARDIAMMYWWQGDTANAKIYFERARDEEAINPAIGLEAKAALAYLAGDLSGVSNFCQTAQLFANPYVADIISMYKILLELEDGNLEAATRTYEASPRETFAACAYARVLSAKGDRTGAKALLDNIITPERNRNLYLSATRYLVSGDERDLEKFLSLTSLGTRLLPGFIPLEHLTEKSELSRYYPIREVLFSGRQADIVARKNDIPELVIHLLGEVTVQLLGEALELTDRHKQILALFTLGLNRDEVAEAMWPEADIKKQRNNFNVQLTALRKLIEPWGLPTYLFDQGFQNVVSDYQELNEALKLSDADKVFLIYQEPLAPGIDLGAVEEERERLHEEVVALLFEASSATTPSQATAFLERVLQLEPLHEESLQTLLQLLVRRGRKREARGRYLAFKEQLAKDMGLEPLDETQRILNPNIAKHEAL